MHAAITEFAGVVGGKNHRAAVPVARDALRMHELALTASPAFTPVLGPRTKLLYIVTDADCYVAIGPSADASSAPQFVLKAGAADYFGMRRGDRVSVVARVVA